MKKHRLPISIVLKLRKKCIIVDRKKENLKRKCRKHIHKEEE